MLNLAGHFGIKNSLEPIEICEIGPGQPKNDCNKLHKKLPWAIYKLLKKRGSGLTCGPV